MARPTVRVGSGFRLCFASRIMARSSLDPQGSWGRPGPAIHPREVEGRTPGDAGEEDGLARRQGCRRSPRRHKETKGRSFDRPFAFQVASPLAGEVRVAARHDPCGTDLRPPFGGHSALFHDPGVGVPRSHRRPTDPQRISPTRHRHARRCARQGPSDSGSMLCRAARPPFAAVAPGGSARYGPSLIRGGDCSGTNKRIVAPPEYATAKYSRPVAGVGRLPHP